MAKHKPDEVKPGAPEWMATYSDLVTLLFCFFVLLYAMSTIDESKFQALANSFSGNPTQVVDFGGGDGISDLLGSGIMQLPELDKSINDSVKKYKQMQEDLEKMASEFKTYFAENNLQDTVVVDVQEQSIRISFLEGILFDSGKAVLKPASLGILSLVADEMLKYPNSGMRVEGHTDDRPMSSVQYPNNWYLSSARAIEVVTYFIDKRGLNPTSLHPIGFGEYSPIATNATAEGRAKNRRVEIIIMSEYYDKKNNQTTMP